MTKGACNASTAFKRSRRDPVPSGSVSGRSVQVDLGLETILSNSHTVDGGNLAPLLQRRFLTAPYPLLIIGIENLQEQICSKDGDLAPPQAEQLPMLKRGYGNASSSHRRCLLCRWCKIFSIRSPVYRVEPSDKRLK